MSAKTSKQKIVEGLATGLYVGRLPWIPGTFGTLWGIPFVYAFSLLSPIGYMFAAIVLLFVAVAISEVYERFHNTHDSSEIVVDEIVGYVIAMTWLPATWQAYLAAFVVFRFFDMLKPYPINKIDQKISGGFGTVLDDVAAGIIANIVLQIVYTKTSFLGAQIHVL